MTSNSSLIGDILTDDLVTEILHRLPVKSLLRFKLVSKPWLSLISSPRFIKSHLHHALTSPAAHQTLIVYQKHHLSISLFQLRSPQIGPSLGVPYSRGEFSFTPFTMLVASQNGVVCVAVADFPRHEMALSNMYKLNNCCLYLWNPATRQSRVLPPHDIREDVMSLCFGFGFDSVGNEFKVVRVVSSFQKPFSAEVYSERKDAWRRVKPKPCDVPYYEVFDVCVNGLLCCTGMYGLMAFDLNKEVFRSGIRIPVRRRDIKRFNARVIVVNESVAVGFFSRDMELSGKVKVWTLDDDACLRGDQVEASWTLVLSIRVDIPGRFVRGYCSSKDLLLVIGEDIWLSYNTEEKEVKPFPDSIYLSQVIKYNESLISIRGSKLVQ